MLGGASALFLCVCALALGACGDNEDSKQSKLESEVTEAMATLPYSFDFLNEHPTDRYVVFRVGPGASVNIAYGGRSKRGECPKPPRLPAKHRRGSKPFAAAGPEPLICFEDDGWRPGASKSAATTRARTASLVANALCEEVYDEEAYEDFACFD
jgi:hypothetical protein